MGTYYIAACHSCRTSTMFPKCSKESAESAFRIYNEKFHKGHDTGMADDYDIHFDARIRGCEVVVEGWAGHIERRVSDPYTTTAEGDQIFDGEGEDG